MFIIIEYIYIFCLHFRLQTSVLIKTF